MSVTHELKHLHGERGAQLAAESHSAAIDKIEAIVTKESIACQFERLDGYLFVPPGESTDVLDQELEATHHAGLTSVERVPRAPLDGFHTGPCLRFPRQAQFHPIKYLEALARAIEKKGGRIVTMTHAEECDDGAPVRVKTSHGPIVSANALVMATNTQ